jgi:DNA repair protein RadA/Sms
MAKQQTIFYCTECGTESYSYLGKCSACGTWGSLKEARFDKVSKSTLRGGTKSRREVSDSGTLFINAEAQMMSLREIPDEQINRMLSESLELDRVLGGGIVSGSLTLLGGEPGIGKSTLLIQVADRLARKGSKVLYISAEESSRQLKLRARRLKIDSDIKILAENNLERIIDTIETEEPSFVIVDSIQALFAPKLDSLPGSPSQIKENASRLMRVAKTTNIPIFLVGHINKDGDLAGPKILEHMVDTVIQFEGSSDSQLRFLRSAKNRFGSTDEVGIFKMDETGLHDLNNPSEIFLEEKSGGMLFAAREGRRTLLLEIQALALNSDYSNPRRIANGIELSRLHQILAIVEKKLGISLSKTDIYLNVVGGISIKDTAVDLAIALAIYNSVIGQSNDKDIVALGELGLSGEIRSVTNLEARIKECLKLGYKTIIIPESTGLSLRGTKCRSNVPNEGLDDAKIITAKNISDLVKAKYK